MSAHVFRALGSLPRASGSSASFAVPSRSHTGYISFEGRKDFKDDELARFMRQCRELNLQVRELNLKN